MRGCDRLRSRIGNGLTGPLARILPAPLFVHPRRAAAPIDLAGGQDIGPVPQHTTDEGRGIAGRRWRRCFA